MINQELSKVPLDIGGSILEGKGFLEIGKYRPSFGPIDICLREQDQTIPHSTKFVDGRDDFWLTTGFLAQELIAWEGKYLKALVS